MGDIVNLRQARKAKARDRHEKDAASNRVKYGTSKASRTASAAEKVRGERAIDSHKLEND